MDSMLTRFQALYYVFFTEVSHLNPSRTYGLANITSLLQIGQERVKEIGQVCTAKKIRDTKGTFHAKMCSIKDRNGMDLTEAEDLRRGGKNTQKNCTKKIFTTQIITMV